VTGYLLDTNIVSEVRKHQRANPQVLAWLETVEDDDLFLSVLVLAEIRKGIEQAGLRIRPRRGFLNGGWRDWRQPMGTVFFPLPLRSPTDGVA